VAADSLHILHQFLRGVVFQARMRDGAPRPTLIKQDDAVHTGVEKAPVVIFAARAGAAVHKKHRQSLGIAGFLNIEYMGLIDPQFVRAVGLYFRIESVHGAVALRRYQELRLNNPAGRPYLPTPIPAQ